MLHLQRKVVLDLITSFHVWYQVADALYKTVFTECVIIAGAEWDDLTLLEGAAWL